MSKRIDAETTPPPSPSQPLPSPSFDASWQAAFRFALRGVPVPLRSRAPVPARVPVRQAPSFDANWRCESRSNLPVPSTFPFAFRTAIADCGNGWTLPVAIPRCSCGFLGRTAQGAHPEAIWRLFAPCPMASHGLQEKRLRRAPRRLDAMAANFGATGAWRGVAAARTGVASRESAAHGVLQAAYGDGTKKRGASAPLRSRLAGGYAASRSRRRFSAMATCAFVGSQCFAHACMTSRRFSKYFVRL